MLRITRVRQSNSLPWTRTIRAQTSPLFRQAYYNRINISSSRMSTTPVTYITAEELERHINPDGSVTTTKFLVVDVRDDDFRGGNIKNALHMPSEGFLDSMHKLADRVQQEKIEKIIFHCMYSSQRGPTAALHFRNYWDEKFAEDGVPFPLSIHVLKGGFVGWISRHRTGNPVFVENYDERVWKHQLRYL
eukprot:GEZU01020716.1.p1 GENE.GEZU01020716.1~~GEZU01020716.1.p1  ORF type:complete len:190 (-),score=10.89 GEZU01020716.1:149-718(-)